LTIGSFDGVHQGHQKLKTLTAEAHRAEAPAVVLTFYPHPAAVLGKRRDAGIGILASGMLASKMLLFNAPEERAALWAGWAWISSLPTRFNCQSLP
jgi:hypothetical protein